MVPEAVLEKLEPMNMTTIKWQPIQGQQIWSPNTAYTYTVCVRFAMPTLFCYISTLTSMDMEQNTKDLA